MGNSGYQQLPPRNPRSGRTAVSPRKGSGKSGKTSAAPVTRQQFWVLLVLFICFLIPLGFFLHYENSRNQLHLQQQAYEKEVTRHKVRYEEYIRYYASLNNIDPAFVAAVIKRESDYDPRAVSSAGARGLMQIMPENLDWLAGKVDLYDYTVDTLFDAEENIKMGCWYLGYLSRLFDGDPITIACAYHAGQGNVRDHWLPKYSSNGKSLTLDEIPMDDTKYYARKVLEAYAIYQQNHYKAPDSSAGVVPVL